MLLELLFFSLLSWAKSPDKELRQFDDLLQEHPTQIWSPDIGQKLKSAIHDYNAHTKLKNGLIYGDSVRRYSLKGKCAANIEKDMKRLGCKKQIDVIREPKENQPILTSSGITTPIWQFVCADGGVIKIKPQGDPMSKHTPFPHGSRTLRYPANTLYRDYRDEVAKISEDGHIIPRSPSDLKPKYLVNGWSQDAHIPLEECKK